MNLNSNKFSANIFGFDKIVVPVVPNLIFEDLNLIYATQYDYDCVLILLLVYMQNILTIEDGNLLKTQLRV